MVTAWAASMALHAVMFILMFLTPGLVGMPQALEEVPVALTDLYGPVESEVQQADLDLPTRSPDSGVDPLAQPEPMTVAPKRFGSLSETITAARPGLSIVGIGTSSGTGSQMLGLGGGGGEPGPTFFGLGGGKAKGAKRIVYVVDRSGSMMTTFQAVRRELQASIQRLRMTQRFHVVFFNSGQPTENPPKRLVPATQSQKGAAFEFLDSIYAEGNTDPIPAMKRALAVKPDLIYFLTDGDFDPALIEKLHEWNHGKQVRIFTLAYVSETGRVLLEQIARENNGEFRFISEDEIF